VESLDSTTGIVALAAAGVAVIALLVATSAALRMRRLRAAQKAVIGEHGSEDLVVHGLRSRERVDELERTIEEISETLAERMAGAERRLDGSVSRVGVLRYDAFNESTGRQSSSIALLDDRADGVVISAILQREQARVYAKPIVAGDSELELSPEEREAMRIAVERDGR
jgi:hypothetical protein